MSIFSQKLKKKFKLMPNCELKKKFIIVGTSLEVGRFPPRKKYMFKLPSVTTSFCILNLNKIFVCIP